jgi:predicted NodU family carbamoyl transferase
MFHDASVCVVDEGKIMFAGHSERYSKKKNDAFLHKELMAEALTFGMPDVIVVHEDSKLKSKRRLKQMRMLAVKSAFIEPTAEVLSTARRYSSSAYITSSKSCRRRSTH